MLLNPAGSARSNSLVASSQWWSIPTWKRVGLALFLTDWLENHEDAEIEIYGALPVLNPQSLCTAEGYSSYYIDEDSCGDSLYDNLHYPCPAECDAYIPSPFNLDDVCVFDQIIDPWKDLGVTRYWLDWSSGATTWPSFIEFAHCPLYRSSSSDPHFLGAEAFPRGGNPVEIDLTRAQLAPAMAFPNVLMSDDSDRSWDVSVYANSTELVAVLDQFSSTSLGIETLDGVLDWAQRGFVIYVVNAETLGASRLVEQVKRVYDFGVIQNPADFNGDGSVDINDEGDFDYLWNIYKDTASGANFVHGDYTRDGAVDDDDYELFADYYYEEISTPIDLGTADPQNVFTPLP